MPFQKKAVLIALAMLAVSTTAQSPSALPVKINQIQVIGTHNSYHAGIAPSETKIWKEKSPETFAGVDYQHATLTRQFDNGVRQIELDIFADTHGGRYAHPSGPSSVTAAGLPADPEFDPHGLMAQPGFKVMHVQDLDYRSTCEPFTDCLGQVRTWLHGHPAAGPIFILVETKQGVPKGTRLTETEMFTTATFDALDAEIRSVFSPSELIVPDDVRGHFDTLEKAVLDGNWPSLQSARGKVVFLLDQRWAGPLHLVGHPSLRGRVLFTNAEPGQADAAFIERNDGPPEEIAALVRKGYLVRTRTDADTKQARTNSTARRDAMLASGAQLLSTDYPHFEPARWPGAYIVELPDNTPVRCNVINAPTIAVRTRYPDSVPFRASNGLSPSTVSAVEG